MTRTLPLCALLATVAACSANGGGGGAKPDLSTDDAKVHYALGFTVGSNMARGKPFTAEQAAAIAAGLDDSATSKTAQLDMQTYGPKVQQMMTARMGAPGAGPGGPGGPGAPPADPGKLLEEKKKGADFAETAAKAPGAEKLASGLVFKSTSPGTGASPTATDVVKVNYEGKLTDGTVFDASSKHGGPASFPLNRVIPCWTEGVQKLKVGGKAQLVCPSSIAYGDTGHPPAIPGGATLVFTIELLDINAATEPRPAMAGAAGGNVDPKTMMVPARDANGQPVLQIRPPPPPPPKP
jgi:FKBP-type peptidyl-prolyl cis-trans isomerase FkpA